MAISKTKTERHGFADVVAIAVATGAGAGFSPVAPGTAGSILGVAIYLAIEAMTLSPYYLHAIIFLFIVGTWAAQRVEALWGHDSQRIVVDEIVGQMIAFGYVAGRLKLSAAFIVIGFGLFRLFDILKPFPLRRLEKLRGGFGVIADDVGAGVYALALLTLIINLFGA